MLEAITFVVFGVAVLCAAWIALRAEKARGAALARLAAAEAKTGMAETSAARINAELNALRSERDGLALSLERERAEARGLERQIADLVEAKDQMLLAFNKSAGDLMKANKDSFQADSKTLLDGLLGPLKEDIAKFNRSLGDAHTALAQQHGALRQQITHLSERSEEQSKETLALTRALKGNVQKQGAWGEMIVDTILTHLGLREGIEYTRQQTFSDDDGRVRTDYIVNLPNGERIVIDSKVSLVDFERYVNASSEEEGAAHRAAHVRSMRAHIRGLARKEYHARAGSGLDFVIMFVPIEAALGAAWDETLCLDAADCNISIATPTTLTTQLQTIRALWKIELRNRNAENIAKRAGALYDQFVLAAREIEAIGEHIGASQNAYEQALKKLTSGKGNVIRQVEMIREMGAKASRTMPDFLSDAARADEPDDLLRLDDGADDASKLFHKSPKDGDTLAGAPKAA